ncbi:MAG: pyridoxamine 5'-phosphate oxidase family protein [Desulfarculaceae bacterium]|nr:pyridoxamine 5'-phosphate oxidase family protein [Desulfarculaceae bacterium]MCF8071076.1 pyridoxamine 5'-phosphate oxidase family protein [Desulfarculaceae bacterium]MCF8100664.1 pyridoxamine 5'-phosphate oxidase family protein [Desulfarculaceae bacterium]MCF8116902.1 pyridoxamine 5'-phosphate oxidase family protein [Desulfarculaceae bacterium]
MQLEIRRKDRDAGSEQAWRILEQGEYGVLSTVSPDGQPYGIPLSYWLRDGALFFHCALSGRKLDNLAHEPRACFCVVGATQLLPDQFSTVYCSALAFGRVSEVEEIEKQEALEALVDKYSPGRHAEGLAYIGKLKERARVFRMSVEGVSAKARGLS